MPGAGLAFCAAVWFCFPGAAAATLGGREVPTHPLDPISIKEIHETVEVLRTAGKTTDSSRFSLIELREPPKETVRTFHPGAHFNRQAFAVVYNRAANQTFEAIVDLTRSTLVSWKQLPDVQPSYLLDDTDIVERAVRADPHFPEIMRRHGVTDVSRVGIGDWAGGYFGDPEDTGYRYRRADFSYHDAQGYSDRKIENVSADVNLNTGKVVRWTDGPVVPIPAEGAGLTGLPAVPTRQSPTPLVITQPQGTSFTIQDGEVRWQNWSFRLGFNAREGLILYQVRYEDGGRLRSVLYRGSCSEMVVPYGDPGINWFYKNAFDAGEDSFGRYADRLEPQKDVPDYASTFDLTLPNESGGWFTVPRAVAVYERDGGLLWKHYDKGQNWNESRRARDLVVAWIATVGNYDYGFNWIFHQDGSLEMEVSLTGFMDVKASALRSVSAADHHAGDLRYGHLVAPNVIAVHHQHFFSFRLDLDVDGEANSVLESNTQAVPAGTEDRYQNAFTMTETLLQNEQEAARLMDLEHSRRWTVINPSVRNSLGYPVGYTLVPGENSISYAGVGSWVRKRASFTNAHFWVTPYDPSQLYAAGFYVNQSRGKDGLARWIEAKRSIVNKDVVIWYTMGITHIPRPEEYPVMAVHKAGFLLVPNSFFVKNPADGLP
jgi:primary-amine oxidase